MLNSINTDLYKWIPDDSCYNHNIYYSKELDDIILEECDDDNFFSYYRMIENSQYQHLGNIVSDEGIFDKGGIQEVDTNCN